MTTPLFAVQCRGGLCNRMRVITSFALVAHRTGRELRVQWPLSDSGFSDETLDELFEHSYDQVDPDDFHRYCDEGLALHDVIALVGHGPDRQWRWRDGLTFDDIFDTARWPVVTYRGFLRADTALGPGVSANVPQMRDRYAEQLRGWRPTADIRDDVDRLTAGFDAHTVGVHVRRGDALVANDTMGQRVRRSTDEAFVKRMDALVQTQDATTFFLATDDEETEDRFRSRYGDRVMTNDTKTFVPSVLGAPKDNQRDAVIDLYALARTSRLLGTQGSSFTTVASIIGDIPVEHAAEHSFMSRARAKLLLERSRLRRRLGRP